LFFRSYKYAVSWAALILVLSCLPAAEFENKQINHFDLLIHFFMYGIFTLLLVLGNVRRMQYIKHLGYPLISAWCVAVLFGLVVEFLQGTVFVSRSFEWYDALANAVGSSVGAALFYLIFGKPQNYVIWKKNCPGVLRTPKKTHSGFL